MPFRLLRGSSLVEFGSLLLLLANLATVHWPGLASLLGPVHGCAYLCVLGATVRVSPDLRARLIAAVPGIGGLLVLRRLRRRPGQGGTRGDVSARATGR